ncbi:MAG: ATP-binding cassette domain-containing protein [Propionibacteriaceae bacterium]|jgi:peptide/nickel transport system ATP-binding protein|nr:ATP-binding cassette domain-containing protein [Propionibacteriaceae bacterium]
MPELYHLSQVSRVFGKGANQVNALVDIDLTVDAGERLGVVGGSGSGKTTLLRLLAALDRPTSGNVYFDGQDIGLAKERELRLFRSRVQPVFQDPRSSLDPRMTVGEIVTEPLNVAFPAPPNPKLLTAAETLELVGLDPDSAAKYPHEFSGGQRQRIAIARALTPDPQVLLADEPVSALDVLVRDNIIALLRSLVTSRSLTLVLISHDISVIRDLCDTVIVLNHGHIEERGPVSTVLTHPKSPYTQHLLASVPTL